MAVLAALAGWVGLAEPALALDKVKFATNWLADPEEGGFFQAAADGTYAQYGLDVTIIPGGPQTNGALMLLFGRIEFYMGGDMIGDFLSAEGKAPAGRRRRRFPKVAADLHVASGPRARQMGGSAESRSPVYVGAGSINTFYAWLKLVYGFKDETSGLIISIPPHSSSTRRDPARLCHRRAIRNRKAGRFQAEHFPALRLRL